MKKILLLLCVSMVGALAQAPNCSLSFGPWTTSNETNIQANTSVANQCAYWILSYQVTGSPTISIQFEGATGVTQPATASFAAFQGSTVSGSNPSTSTTCSTVTNCVAVFTGYIPWYRVTMTLSGAGTVSGVLQGYKTYQTTGGNTPSSGGCAGTVATPCVVAGPVTAGSAVGATGPVQVSGSDGTNVRRILTDTSGRQIAVGAAASGATAAGNPVLIAGVDTAGPNARAIHTDSAGGVSPSSTNQTPGDAVSNTSIPGMTSSADALLYERNLPYLFNGVSWDRQFSCQSVASVTFTAASGSLQVVALSASKIIRICSIALSSDTATNITLQNGTGANCGTGTTSLSGAFQNVLSLVIPFGADSALRVPVSNAFCINSSVAATIGGVVTYAQF